MPPGARWPPKRSSGLEAASGELAHRDPADLPAAVDPDVDDGSGPIAGRVGGGRTTRDGRLGGEALRIHVDTESLEASAIPESGVEGLHVVRDIERGTCGLFARGRQPPGEEIAGEVAADGALDHRSRVDGRVHRDVEPLGRYRLIPEQCAMEVQGAVAAG